MSHNTIVEKFEPHDVSLELARELQDIALNGWANALTRPKTELRTQFDPTNTRHVANVREIYKEYADKKNGGLFIAHHTGAIGIAGFILADEEVSGTRLEQAYKRLLYPEKVYAHIRQVCVESNLQGKAGIGGALVRTALETFNPVQKPTAHIFDENEVAHKAFKKWGYVVTPAEQEPRVLEGYFGEGTPDVYQKRYEAASIDAVIAAISNTEAS